MRILNNLKNIMMLNKHINHILLRLNFASIVIASEAKPSVAISYR
jgi:hypothetical protein